MITKTEELGRLIKTSPPRSDDGKKDGKYEGDDDKEKFCSVRSCFSRCSIGDEDCFLSGRTEEALATLSEEWFGECEGWPFGLWRRRKILSWPPLPKSPADSWTWHKRNLSNVKV
ncbi:uncharacterized protein LOC110021981 [Phalaenopsis equestris]|uniref:uncharacterized protein LOC110021981 n=1 Tax=Phalaenopsis equestris TaxID=78828 RepID=UPI0009E65873|nr:uncharacterized protein LOC110021981 [Phalaenopsis equestris]